MAMAASKVLQIIITIITIPLVLKSLGQNDFGTFIAVQALATWFLFDNGLTESVKKVIIDSKEKGEWEKINKLIISSIVFLFTVVLFIYLIIFLLNDFFLFSQYIFSNDDVDFNVLWASVLFLIPLKLSKEILTAMEKGYVYSVMMMLSPVFQMALTWYGFEEKLSLNYFIITLFLPQLISNLLSWVYIFSYQDTNFVLNLKLFSIDELIGIKKDTVHFMVLGISLMVINVLDPFIINIVSTQETTAEYSFIYRIGVYAAVIVSFLVYPMWPAIGSALAQGEYGWAKQKSISLIKVSVIIGFIASCIIAFLGGYIVNKWSGGVINVSNISCYFMAIFVFVKIVTSTLSILLKAYGVIKEQAKVIVVETVFHVLTLIFFTRIYGVEGALFAILASIICTRGVFFPKYIYQILRSKHVY